MSVSLCRCCGIAFDDDELVEGTCQLCMECFDPNPAPLDFDELYDKINAPCYDKIDETGDCV